MIERAFFIARRVAWILLSGFFAVGALGLALIAEWALAATFGVLAAAAAYGAVRNPRPSLRWAMSRKDPGVFGPAGVLAIFAAAAVAVVVLLVTSTPSSGPSAPLPPPRKTAQSERALKLAAREAEERRQGFHCLSGLDGSHKGLVGQIKASLRDPDSFRALDTLISPVTSQGFHRLTMEYTARNGFGGTNRERVEAAVDHQTCEAILLNRQSK